jgi:hypothetical protein
MTVPLMLGNGLLGTANPSGREESPEAEPNTGVRKVSTHGKNVPFLGLWKMVKQRFRRV